MRRYETIFILRPSLGENEIENLIENTLQIIKNDNGSIIDLDRWGMRKLAYLIKKETQGYYVLIDFSAPSEAVSEMERKFRIDDSVLKYMTVKVADAIDEKEIDAARQAVEERKAAKKAAEEAALAGHPESEDDSILEDEEDNSDDDFDTDDETDEDE